MDYQKNYAYPTNFEQQPTDLNQRQQNQMMPSTQYQNQFAPTQIQIPQPYPQQQQQFIPQPAPTPILPQQPITTPVQPIITPPLIIEQSYIENILRLNKGKVGTFYFTYTDSNEWRDRIFKGVIEAAGRDHLIISDPKTGKRYLFQMIYFQWAEFDEEINYDYPFQ